MKTGGSIVALIGAALVAGAMSVSGAPSASVDYASLAEGAFKGTVRRAETRDRQLGVIELFRAALLFCRSGRHLDSLDVLFDVAAEMQDRREESRGCGNFRWNWRDGFVMDYNAVDFCMEYASLIARDHLDALSSGQRAKFKDLLDWSIRGALAHRVRDSYTNIAIMNAVNLVLLGEACDRPDVFAEGVKRLNAFMLNTALYGVCEYSSPTYSAVDVDNLHRLHANVRDPAVKAKAERLLRLFWTDLAASSFAGAGRLGGPHSRDYDYLYGMGAVASYLRQSGLVSVASAGESPIVDYAEDDWRPDDSIRELVRRVPRLVVSRWGCEKEQCRVYWAGRHVALGVAGANYWNMDVPLAVDFAASNRMARGYFIADGRRDPYGRKRIPEGQGPHQKTLHLRPFWAGVQRACDALGMAVYRYDDIPEESPTLESHFVIPSDADEIMVDGRPVELRAGQPFSMELPSGGTVFVRHGDGAMAVRAVWMRGVGGRPAKAAFVWDALAEVPACRLTVAHHDYWGATADSPTAPRPGAAFWVRVSDEAGTRSSFAKFRERFLADGAKRPDALAGGADSELRLAVVGEEGPLTIALERSFDADSASCSPLPEPAVLAVDGRDLGMEALGEVPGLAAYRAEEERTRKSMEANVVTVPPDGEVVWEAEKGAVKPKMTIADDPLAGGGKYVWAPGEPGAGGGGPGEISWQLQVRKTGKYRLRGRVNAPTPDDDSFYVTTVEGVYSSHGVKGRKLLPRTDWSVGVTKGAWKWSDFPLELELTKGPCVLTLSVREDGTKIDRLALTPFE